MDDSNSIFIPRNNALKDEKRIGYHNGYLGNLSAAITYVLVDSVDETYGIFDNIMNTCTMQGGWV